MSTIGGTVTSTVTLGTSGSYATPLTIASGGEVSVSSGFAIYGSPLVAWQVANYGTVKAANSDGIHLGGDNVLVKNGALGNVAAYIYGKVSGVAMAPGTLGNYGTIKGGAVGVYVNVGTFSALVANIGSHSLIAGVGGVYIKDTGTGTGSVSQRRHDLGEWNRRRRPDHRARHGHQHWHDRGDRRRLRRRSWRRR